MADTAIAIPYELPPDFVDFRDTVREIVRERIAPRAAEIDARAEYPWDVRELLAAHDVLALPFARDHGGPGTGTLLLNLVIEEIARACASSALILMLQELGTLPIKLFGTERQQQAWLPRCATGEWAPAFALSEAEAGSDPSAMRTTAARDGDEWVIAGTKTSVSNAGIADFYVVFAVTDAGARCSTAFVVDTGRPGVRVGKLEHRLGIRGSPTGSAVFEGVRVPDEHRIGDVDGGLAVALATLERSRLGAGAQAVGIAQGATDHATAYATAQIAFGQPLIDIGAIQHKLADMATRTAAARELLYRACALADTSSPRTAQHSSMAQPFASDIAMEVAAGAVQVLGGHGDASEYPVERMMRDAMITQIYGGTNEIQRAVIARELTARANGLRR